MPRFLADECFSGPMFRALLAAGLISSGPRKPCHLGTTGVFSRSAFREGRVLLTEDTDFGKLTVQLGTPSLGVVRIVLKTMGKEARITRAVSALLNLGDRVLNSITVIEPNSGAHPSALRTARETAQPPALHPSSPPPQAAGPPAPGSPPRPRPRTCSMRTSVSTGIENGDGLSSGMNSTRS